MEIIYQRHHNLSRMETLEEKPEIDYNAAKSLHKVKSQKRYKVSLTELVYRYFSFNNCSTLCYSLQLIKKNYFAHNS